MLSSRTLAFRCCAVGFCVALTAAACGADVALDESASPTATATAPEAPTEAASPTPTEPPAATPTPEPTSAATPEPTPTATPFPTPAGVDYHEPGELEVVGTGLVEGFSLDGSALLVSEELEDDDTIACEGFPPPVLQRIELATGEKSVAVDDPSAYGVLTRDGTGRVIITTQCEGFFVAQYLVNETTAGEFEIAGEVPYEAPGPEAVAHTDLRSGEELATVVLADGPGSDRGQGSVVRLDPVTAELDTVIEGDYFEAESVFADRLLVSGLDGEVTLLDSDTEVVASWSADRAYVSPDRTAAILVDGDDVWLVELATGIEALIATLPDPIGDLAWAPDGSVVVAVSSGEPSSVFMLGLDGRITDLVGSGDYARPVFSATGDAVAFNDLTDSDDFSYDAVVVRFG